MFLVAEFRDISFSIISNWLSDVKSLARLEMACCARAPLSAFKEILQLSPTIQILSHVFLESLTISKMEEFIKWSMCRELRFRSLSVDANGVVVLLNCRGGPLLCDVSALTITSQTRMNAHAFSDLLMCMPSVCDLDMSRYYVEHDGPKYRRYLRRIIASHIPLKSLNLDNNDESCEYLPEIFTAFGGTLEVLNLGKKRMITAEMLDVLSSCKAIKNLKLNSINIATAAVMMYFASTIYFRNLTNLQFLEKGNILSRDAIIAICENHPILTHLGVEGNRFKTSLTDCAIILEICPDMAMLSLSAFEYMIEYDNKTNSNFSSLQILHQYDEWSLDELLLNDEISKIVACREAAPINSLSDGCNFIENRGLEIVTKTCGKTLSSVHLLLLDVDFEHFSAFVSTCSALKYVHLEVGQCDDFDDEFLEAIADNCLFITTLAVTGAKHITDDGMAYLLNKIGKILQDLDVSDCSELSQDFLECVVEYCVELSYLHICGTVISSKNIVDVLVVPNETSLRYLEVGAETLRELNSSIGFLSPLYRWPTITHKRVSDVDDSDEDESDDDDF